MTWTRLSDDFADHPDLLNVGRSARLLHVEALVYCNRHGNDGQFRRALVARMTDSEAWPELVDELLKHDVWADAGDGVLQIDWKRWAQEPAAVVRERREANTEANRIYRERGKRHRADDHSICTDKCPVIRALSQVMGSRDQSRNQSRDGSRDPYPSRPLPTRPSETERGRGGTATNGRSAGATHPSGAATPARGTTPFELGIEPKVTVHKTRS